MKELYYNNFNLVENFNKMIERKRVFHSYLFYGDENKTNNKFAKLFAQALFCEGQDFLCDECPSCEKIKSLNHPDFVEIKGFDSDTQTLNVEDVRDLIKNCFVKPNEGKYKIFLLNNVDCLFASAANAMLKILEEPPQNVIFLMTAKNKHKVLKTIKSRSILFFVAPSKESDCFKILESLNLDISVEKKKEISSLSLGKIELLKFYATTKEGENVLEISSKLFDAYLKGNEFCFLSVLFLAEKNSNFLFKVFECFLARILIFVENNQLKLKRKEIEKIYNNVLIMQDFADDLQKNANLNLAIAALCCKIF